MGDDRRCRDDSGPRSDDGVTGLDEVLNCLANSVRREVLYYLRREEVASVDELATQVAARETGVPPEDVHEDEQQRFIVKLVHRDLPKLTAARFVEYDRRSRTARYTDPPALLDRVLKLLSRLEGRRRQ